MTAHSLIFANPAPPPDLPARLAFSNGGDDVAVPTVHRLVFGAPALTNLPVHLVFGNVDVEPTPEPAVVTVSLVARITSLSGFVTTQYISDTVRPTVGAIAGRWQDARRLHRDFSSEWQDAAPLPIARLAKFQHARPMGHSLRARWSDANRSARYMQARYERADRVGTWPLRGAFQQAVPRGVVAPTTYAPALRVGTWPVGVRFQEAYRDRRRWVAVRYQDGVGIVVGFVETASDALPFRIYGRTRYQDARRPPIGAWVRPVVPPAPDPCYVPGLPVRLVFTQEGTGLPLVFFCERAAPPPPGGTVVVPIRRVYMIFNSVTLYRVDTGAALRALSFSMSLNDGSWTWNWEASLHESARNHLGRDGSGRPAELAVVVNGVNFRLLLENRAKDERFSPELRFSVSGRGKAAMLDEAYAPSMNFGNTADRTAQQLAAEVLTINGAPIGWDIEWGLTDWLVPGGAWTFQGTYISAINDIATAVGGYVQPHNTDAMLRILPRYPAAPWDWGSVTPDVVIPRMTAEVVSTDYVDKPVYNQVHVGGIAAGVFGPWKRAGTAGDREAPQVTHALITHADAQRQRARAVLSDTGSQALISLSMQVRPESGVIMPGKYIRYQGDEEVMGIVRGVTLNWNRPTLRQVLRVETHE